MAVHQSAEGAQLAVRHGLVDGGMELGVNLRGIEPFGSLFILPGGLEQRVELLSGGRQAHEAYVALGEGGLFLLVEPVAAACFQLGEGFGIELRVVNRLRQVDFPCGKGAQIAARAGEVGDDVEVVTGAHQRGEAALLHGGGGVGLELIHHGQLEHVLQHGLLSLGEAVHLVEVDEPVAGEHEQGLAAVGQREVLGVVRGQLLGHEAAAEGALAYALLAHEDKHGLIALAPVLPVPQGHHAEEPGVGEVIPQLVIDRHAAEESVDTLAAVPLGQGVEVFVEGVVGADAVGVHVDVHVVVAHVDALLLRVEGNGVDGPLGEGAVREVILLPFAVLHHAEHLVVAEGVAALHEGPLAQGTALCLVEFKKFGVVEIRLECRGNQLLHMLLVEREGMAVEDAPAGVRLVQALAVHGVSQHQEVVVGISWPDARQELLEG